MPDKIIIGDATFYHGDCLEVMQEIPDNYVDSVVTDPPFAFAGGISNGIASKADAQFFIHWLKDVFREIQRITKEKSAWFLWCDWRTIAAYTEALREAAGDYYNQRWISQIIIHNRDMVGMGSPFRNQLDYLALIRGKKTNFEKRIPKNQPNIFTKYWYYGKHKNHPSEKDPEVSKMLMNWIADIGDIIFDPFLGSGSSAIGSIGSYNFIGIEKEKKYFDIAVARYRSEIKQLRICDLK